ncbi:hypothetical protein GCT19_23745 [Paraburkholderia sp. CNPSo 3155]|nr:hypothetical protein [Paraburkholderia atlantica]
MKAIYVHPSFATPDLDVVLACLNLSGVVVGTAPRATMKFAPVAPTKSCGFRKPLCLPGCSTGRCAVHVIHSQSSQNQ